MSENGKLRGVVFDLDGLMFNTEDLYQQVGTEMLRRRDKTFDGELLDRMMGRPDRVALQVMIDYHGLSDTVAGLREETTEIFEPILDRELRTMPGLLDLLDALETHGLPKGIATSSGPRFVERVLGCFSLRPRFQFVLTSHDVEQGKPHPEIYLKAAGHLGLEPDGVMVLEDSATGCRAAVAAGAFAVAVPGGHSRGHDFPGAGFIADSLADERIYGALGMG